VVHALNAQTAYVSTAHLQIVSLFLMMKFMDLTVREYDNRFICRSYSVYLLWPGASRRPSCFTAVVQILSLFFFSPPNLRTLVTSPDFATWSMVIQIYEIHSDIQTFGEPLSSRNLAA